MPTYDRRQFVPQAIRYFQRQGYPNKELIVIDDGTDPVSDLMPADWRIHYVRLDKKITLWAKLNLGCERSQGPIIAHWNDDDWYASWRLDYQLRALYEHGTDLCGINELFYFDLCTRQAYRFAYPDDQPVWLAGSTLCYRKTLWSSNHFADVDIGEDGHLLDNTARTFNCAQRLALRRLHDPSAQCKPEKHAGSMVTDSLFRGKNPAAASGRLACLPVL